MFSRSVVEGVVVDCGDAVKMSRVKGLKREVIIYHQSKNMGFVERRLGGKGYL